MNVGARSGVVAVLAGLLVAAVWLWRQGIESPAPTVVAPQEPAAGRVVPEASSTATPALAPESARDVERQVVDSASPNLDPNLRPAVAVESVVRGRVLLPSGEPAADASVRIGGRATQAAADGAFELRCQDGEALVAFLAGFEPVCIDDVAQQPAVRARQRLDVQLPGASLTIDGQLVTADGAPAKGWFLRLHGGTTDCADDGHPPLTAEDFAAGAMVARAQELQSNGWPLAQRRSPNETLVGDDGRFRVAGLRRGHDYVLRAWNQTTLQTAISPPIPAGASGYRFVVPAGEWRERVFGRVIDRQGGAIAGVRVRLTMRVHRSARGESYETGQEARTTGDGSFEFRRVVRDDLLLRFDGPDVRSKYVELPAAAPGEDLLVQLGCECVLQFEPAPGVPLPTAVRVLDQAGNALRFTRQIREGESQSGQRLPTPGGASVLTLRVGDDACWLVLEREGQGERRVPVRVQRGEVATVRG